MAEFEQQPMGELGEPAAVTVLRTGEELPNVLKLSQPLMANGAPVGALAYDFSALTAADLHRASKYLKGLGIPVSIPALDYEYQLVIFSYAVAAKQPQIVLHDLMRMGATDSMRATALARDFLLDSDPGQRELGAVMESGE